jgi:post-segregation antitoxin (ccd killing protein)
MTELKLTLPDALAREAREAGLLTAKAIEEMLRDAMRRKAARAFLANAERVAAAGIAPMTDEEIQAEVEAVRKARRSRRANRR